MLLPAFGAELVYHDAATRLCSVPNPRMEEFPDPNNVHDGTLGTSCNYNMCRDGAPGTNAASVPHLCVQLGNECRVPRAKGGRGARERTCGLVRVDSAAVQLRC